MGLQSLNKFTDCQNSIPVEEKIRLKKSDLSFCSIDTSDIVEGAVEAKIDQAAVICVGISIRVSLNIREPFKCERFS